MDNLKSLPFQRWFQFWEKSEVTGCQIWAGVGLSHLGDVVFCQKNCTRCDAWVGTLSWRSCQSPVAHSFHRGMLKINTKFDAGLFLYPLSHFECNSRTVHMLTQRRLAIPLTSTVKSLFTDVHSSPLFLAARLHRCHENYSCYINNCWTFSGQASYVHGPWTWSMVWELPEGVGWGVWVEGGKEGKIGTTVIM